MLATLHGILRSLGDFLAPPACPGCGVRIESGEALCAGCLERLRETADRHRAQSSLEGIDRVTVLLPYNEFARTMVHALKYHGITGLGEPLGALMGRKCSLPNPPHPGTRLVPVPLHPRKKRERGYNQCDLLARGFAAATGLYIADVLERTRYTPTQTALGQTERRGNVRNAFRYIGGPWPEGLPAVIIDDVLTTGGTVTECAHALRESGCAEISVCVVATPCPGDTVRPVSPLIC